MATLSRSNTYLLQTLPPIHIRLAVKQLSDIAFFNI